MEIMDPDAWWTSLLQTVRASNSIIVASYTYDHPKLTQTLLAWLADTSSFDLLLLVDKEMFEARSAYHEHARLDSLRRGGATVELCRGHGPRGSFHKKILIADRRTAYLGSANFTRKAKTTAKTGSSYAGHPFKSFFVAWTREEVRCGALKKKKAATGVERHLPSMGVGNSGAGDVRHRMSLRHSGVLPRAPPSPLSPERPRHQRDLCGF